MMALMTPECREIRRNILRASNASGHGHIPTSFSIIEMLWAVYSVMKHDPANPQWPERDIFILSKGHAALGFYSVLAQLGYFPIAELNTFGAFQSRLGCHPDRFKAPGVEMSTGSLGHGIAVATGIALAFRLNNSGRRVFTLVGDGEANEGTVWESIMVGTHLQLNNLTILYDNNQSQVRSLPIPNPGQRFAAFGCDVQEVNGHDVASLRQALTKPSSTLKAIVGNTVKGRGCPTLIENIFEWHRKSPNDGQFQQLMRELDAETV